MTLGEKQRLFMRNMTELLVRIHERGYAVATGDGERNKLAFGMMGTKKGYGHPYSNHKIRLAHDWHLFKNVGDDDNPVWEYCSDTEDHREFGEYWESLHPDNVWGGRFNDGNHYSMKHNGRM